MNTRVKGAWVERAAAAAPAPVVAASASAASAIEAVPISCAGVSAAIPPRALDACSTALTRHRDRTARVVCVTAPGTTGVPAGIVVERPRVGPATTPAAQEFVTETVGFSARLGGRVAVPAGTAIVSKGLVVAGLAATATATCYQQRASPVADLRGAAARAGAVGTRRAAATERGTGARSACLAHDDLHLSPGGNRQRSDYLRAQAGRATNTVTGGAGTTLGAVQGERGLGNPGWHRPVLCCAGVMAGDRRRHIADHSRRAGRSALRYRGCRCSGAS